jgi:hypothetical protein
MAVIINEFEVVPQTQTQNQTGEGVSQSPSTQAQGLTAEDVERIAQCQHERLMRVWAH